MKKFLLLLFVLLFIYFSCLAGCGFKIKGLNIHLDELNTGDPNVNMEERIVHYAKRS